MDCFTFDFDDEHRGDFLKTSETSLRGLAGPPETPFVTLWDLVSSIVLLAISAKPRDSKE
jgi:hypothetical protein